MKLKIFTQFILIITLTICSSVYSQKTIKPDVDKTESFIEEVYGSVIEELNYNTPEKINWFKDMVRRVEIVELTDNNRPEKYWLLSETPVITIYNKSLKRNIPFNPNEFNPLKFKLNFMSKDKAVYYIVDNTNYVIIIQPE